MWKTVKLGELVASKGTGLERKASLQSFDKDFPYLKMNNITNDNALDIGAMVSVDASSQEIEKYRLHKNDFLFNTRNSVELVGKSAVFEEDQLVLFNNNILRVKFISAVNAKYVNYFLTSASGKKQLNRVKSGTTNVAAIYYKDLQNIEILLPPLAEQQRIVAKLDAAFAEIDRAILASSDSTNQLRSLSSNSAKEIFIILRDSGKVSPINDVCEAILAGGDAPKDSLSDVREGKYQIPIFANAMKDKGLYGYTENPRVKKPSVTVAGRGSGTGYTEIRREPFLPIVRLIVLTPNDDEVTVEFLKHAIVNLEVLSSGSAIPQLTVPMMKSYEIPVPPLDQQRVLTEKLDTLQRIADECMGVYEKKVESLKTLKSAILTQELQPPQSEAA